MSILVLKILFRKTIYWIFCGHRKILVLVVVLTSLLLVWCTCWWLVSIASKALTPSLPPKQNLHHFRRSRDLAHYLENVQVLIEPTSTPCTNVEEIPVIVLVTSAPDHYKSREAIRETWAKYQPTYFVLGLYGNEVDELLVDNYLEAKQYSDMIVYDFHDHYQNLTLKTALMMQWTLSRCPQAQYMFKTDDDVLVNPWSLKTVLKENHNAKLLGYQINKTRVHRDEYNKWYLPRWLYAPDVLPQFLSGTGYIISGQYLQLILDEALKIPVINLEDVFFTYIVAHKKLGLPLTHDRRLSPYKPYFSIGCVYWRLASVHSLTPEQIFVMWMKIKILANTDSKICDVFGFFYDSDFLLY